MPFRSLIVVLLTLLGCADERDAVNGPRSAEGGRPAGSAVGHPLVNTLRPGEIAVDIIRLSVPRRLSELSAKMGETTRSDPHWYAQHIRKAKPGEPMPYDRRLGLTRSEYDEYISLDREVALIKVDEATITVEEVSDSAIRLDDGSKCSDLTGFVIDFAEDVVRTRYGTLADRSVFEVAAESPLSKYDGYQWTLNDFDANQLRGTSIDFAIGTVPDSGEDFVYFQIYEVQGQDESFRTLILHFRDEDSH